MSKIKLNLVSTPEATRVWSTQDAQRPVIFNGLHLKWTRRLATAASIPVRRKK